MRIEKKTRIHHLPGSDILSDELVIVNMPRAFDTLAFFASLT